jgi:hypothetical protein
VKRILIATSLLLVLAAANVRAQDPLIDDVDTAVESDWAMIRVHFIMPINYVRHFPKDHGQQLQIYFTISGMDTQNLSLLEETRHVSATPVFPDTTIIYAPPVSLHLQRDPSSLSLRFDRDVSYEVRPGDDHRSIVIYLPVVSVQNSPPDSAKEKPANHDTTGK